MSGPVPEADPLASLLSLIFQQEELGVLHALKRLQNVVDSGMGPYFIKHLRAFLFWKGISGLNFPCFLFYAC